MGNYYLYQLAIGLTRSLPLKISYAVAIFLSDIQCLLSKADRKAVESNLKQITGARSIQINQVREVFHHFGKYLVDFFTMTKKGQKNLLKNYVHLEGTEYLNQVIKEGKGGILMSAHLGHWEMAGAVISMLGYPLSVVALSHKDERVNRFFNAQREFFGAKVIQTSVAIRRCIKDLKENRLIAILGDRDFGHHGIPMDFLGKKTCIPKGAAMFSIKTGAPIIPGFLVRTNNDKFELRLFEPIYPPEIKNEQDITDQVLQGFINKYLSIMEEQIKKYPTQWLMFRRFEII